eukprot:jgi/Mesvir1/25374/Mv01417-RA.1
MAHRLLRDTEADGWERSDFPIVCESCLGENPYVRMTKSDYDKECKTCTRPFTVFRWKPGKDARYKKTEICQTCCKIKNVCQVCLLDLEYGLPVQVRDTALGAAAATAEVIPKSDVNREFFAREHERKAAQGLDFEASYGKVRGNDTLLKLQRTTPYYKRNRAHICSFWVRGNCTRGDECPYRHEMPVTGELAHQNIKDRYYGVNDPVAKKLLARAENMPSLVPPPDTSITTLYIGGIDERIKESDLRDVFYAYGEITAIRMVPAHACAFLTYSKRTEAELAAEKQANKLVIKGLRLKLLWGKPQQPQLQREGGEGARGGNGASGSGSGGHYQQQPAQPPPPGAPGAGTGPYMGGPPPAGMYPPQLYHQQMQQRQQQQQQQPAPPQQPQYGGYAPPPSNFFNLPPNMAYAGPNAYGGGMGTPGIPPGGPSYPSMDPHLMGSRPPPPPPPPRGHPSQPRG